MGILETASPHFYVYQEFVNQNLFNSCNYPLSAPLSGGTMCYHHISVPHVYGVLGG